jgi:hypothetical protein
VTIDPRVFGSTPFGNKTALLDLAGTLDLFMKAVARGTFIQTGLTFRTYPLGTPGGPEWLDAVQKTFNGASAALGLPPPPDLQSYSLDQPADFASWVFILGQTSQSLRIAAGLQ